MDLSAQLQRKHQHVPARLYLTHSGVTRFIKSGWWHSRSDDWVIDYINLGRQPQRIGSGKKFTRLSGVVALYAPGTHYYEYRRAGESLDESYITFGLHGEVADAFHALTGRTGFCHFQDPDQIIGHRLRKLAGYLFHARPGAHLLGHSIFLEVLGLILTAKPTGAHLRKICNPDSTRDTDDLPERVERYICQHIGETIRVAELARTAGCSPSSFAHAYPRLTGESPYQTVLRLKVKAAKQLLLQEGLSVKETAGRLGFSSEFQFSRMFKHVEGIAPMRYVLALTHKTRAGRPV